MSIVVGAQQVITSWTLAGQYQRVMDKSELSASVTELTHQLALERDLAVHYVAAGRTPEREEPLRAQFGRVDSAAEAFREKAATITPAYGESASTLTRQMLSRLPEIAATRSTVLGSALLALPTVTKYSQIIAVLAQFHDEIGKGGDQEVLAGDVAALSALSKAYNAASEQRGLLTGAAAAGRFQSGELDRFIAARARQESEVSVFKSVATPDQRQLYDDTVTGALVDRAEAIRLRALAQATDGNRIDIEAERQDDADHWFEASSGSVNGIWTMQRRLGEEINVHSRTMKDAARQDALLAAAYSLLLLLAVLVVTAIMARSLVSPLRRLRTEALHIAGARLPETVRLLRERGDGTGLVPAPIGVDSRDEIGEVARAFDEVHREAIRLAGEESRLRANVNAMFVNLSRRSQTLVQRQLQIIDGLGQGERDERRLAGLFTLDHLATRMRRNNDNLLVLAGQDAPRRWNEPVGLADVVRAALSEVEGAERVAVKLAGGVAVSGQAVNDIVHLLAELIENALAFSPYETRVTVSTGTMESGGLMLSIDDTGIGMTRDELEQANARLARAPTVDVSVSRRMGLFVVARLAQRHGVRVRLRSHAAGLTAIVFLPGSLLHYHLGPAQPTPAAFPSSPDRPSGFFTPPPAPRGAGPGYFGTPAAQHVAPGAEPEPYSTPAVANWPSFATDPSDTAAPRDLAPPPVWPGPPGPYGPAPPPRSPAFYPPQAGPPARGADDYLPIFAAVESAWFDRDRSDVWSSPQADAGWSAAQAAASPVDDGATPSGLPKRVPRANLVPGTADSASTPKGVAPIPRISPDRVRNRLAGFQQGVRAARDDLSTGNPTPPGPWRTPPGQGA
ncbi:sensor histidine kinase [Nonomuraea sp. KM88]|uniref:sensor histidine kinase n=1 Tax=Nonomuraea sp. KM88 TaxID=3457427 RepID=UPI003FCE5A82